MLIDQPRGLWTARFFYGIDVIIDLSSGAMLMTLFSHQLIK